MIWTRINGNFSEHSKIKRLARNLGISKAQAIGHVMGVMCMFLRDNPQDADAEDIVSASEYYEDDDRLLGEFIICKFIREEEGVFFFNWEEINNG